MIKQKALVLAVAAVLAMPLAACGNSGASTTTDTKSEATTAQSSSSSSDSKTKDASYYAGQWRGSVETTGQTVYGTAGGTEQMLDVFLNEDGTAETKPCKNHEDLLTATGTWALDGDTVTLELDGKTISMTIEKFCSSGGASCSRYSMRACSRAVSDFSQKGSLLFECDGVVF